MDESKTSGFVYILRGSCDAFKIGKTVDLNDRINTLSRQYEGVELIKYVETNDINKLETFLHRLFRPQNLLDYKGSKEWYSLAEDDLNMIMNLPTYVSADEIEFEVYSKPASNKTTVLLNRKMHTQLKIASALKNCSMVALLEEALSDYLQKHNLNKTLNSKIK